MREDFAGIVISARQVSVTLVFLKGVSVAHSQITSTTFIRYNIQWHQVQPGSGFHLGRYLNWIGTHLVAFRYLLESVIIAFPGHRKNVPWTANNRIR